MSNRVLGPQRHFGVYADEYKRSLEDPSGFWKEAAQKIDWYEQTDEVLVGSAETKFSWFGRWRLNTCWNALDRHVLNGRADQAALIYDSPVTDTKRTYSYSELLDEVSKFAGTLQALGVEKGDCVLVYMSMIPEAVIAMLACARIGAIHSVVFGGFAPQELAKRIDNATPKVVLTASCGIQGAPVPYLPILTKAFAMAKSQPAHALMLQRTAPNCAAAELVHPFSDWAETVKKLGRPTECVEMHGSDPLYVLYTSGTTGQPKGVVRENAGHAVALNWSMKNLYGMKPGQVWWAASDIGWVVGHSYITYAPLLYGCTTVLYEGKPVGTPDAAAFWRVIEEYSVTAMFTAPTAIRAIKGVDPHGKLAGRYPMKNFRTLFLAGERADPDSIEWCKKVLGVPVIDHWWQTETGWSICGNYIGIEQLPVKNGSSTVPGPGYDVRVVDDDGTEVANGTLGNLVIKLPLPPSCFNSLWNNEDRYQSEYITRFPGFYHSGDAGYIDEDGYVFVMGRTDDVINVAGKRLSSGVIEEVLADHADVAEAAVVAREDELKGHVPVGFVVLNSGVERAEADIIRELVQEVRDRVGPVASFKEVLVVQRLPKTRSGKTLRGTMRGLAAGQQVVTPATIEDESVLDEISQCFTKTK